ncbi:MAG TPA: nuclear transport factor 2 family protein [Longimicrobium sp.]|nr:nuclear transport factor 2 family protein [Longimicrobium sp.]
MKRIIPALFVLLAAPAIAGAQQNPPSPQQQAPQLPSVQLPPELDRVLRDYERAWQARDPAALAALFTDDGFVLSNGRPPVRGRAAVQQAYAGQGGPLALRALAYAAGDSVGYIIGGYAGSAGDADDGKFILAIRRAPGGPWRIAADIDNPNRRPQRQPGAPGAPGAPAPGAPAGPPPAPPQP